ncbi:MAG: hypothetical protein OXH64_04355 [Rhodospirillaceae bacterium]|nr:hypothetical protein [Rhodospirillaceae bacterium]
MAVMTERHLRAATAAEIPAGTEPPREIQLLPAGEIRTRPHDSRAPWHMPDPAAVVAATAALGLDLPIDYEHQTQLSEVNGKPAPAAGWIKRVFERAGAIWAEVEWLEEAAAMIKSRAYRFVSATFDYEKDTRRVVRIRGAGLTNDPALMQRALARTQTEKTEEESDMDLEKLRKALGLAKTATEAEILAAAEAAAAGAKGLVAVAKAAGLAEDTAADAVAPAVKALVDGGKAVAKAAGLAEGASAKDVEQAVAAAKAGGGTQGGDPDPSKFVPRSEFDRVSERLTALEESGAESTATAAVDAAIKDGKVAPANREWALGYAKKDAEGFAQFVKGAPKILSDGRVAPATDGKEAGDALTADEKAVCRAMGLSEEDYLKSKKALDEARETEG